MCGILAIVRSNKENGAEDLIKASSIISHRGPDDEGFLTWSPGTVPEIWAGRDTASSTLDFWKYKYLSPHQNFKVGFAHRRLSILDLSPRGHQPMMHGPTGISIVFNGEIYNFETIRQELIAKGYEFHTATDSEVLLLAWVAWGRACLDKLNGMFSFTVLDPRDGGKLYAVRDRFGVKPLYWTQTDEQIVFCSEIKQIRACGGYKLALNEHKVFQYLADGKVDTDEQTFDKNVRQIPGGSLAVVTLSGQAPDVRIERWYELKPGKFNGSDEEAIKTFATLLQDSVRLRLRADVPVGSCLSGGLDSSAIVCLVKEILDGIGDHKGQETVTACYPDKRFDEWNFASEVIMRTNATSHRIFPDFERLKADIDKLLWHQDDPFLSTSQFSQWCVFAGSADAGLKVMIDGQGSDEQLSGYGGNDLALYTGLLGKMKFSELKNEVNYYKNKKGGYPIGFLLGAMQVLLPRFFTGLFPKKYRVVKPIDAPWVKLPETIKEKKYYRSLKESLKDQVLASPLPSLLRYEDRSSMAWSIESRVPFMDYRFVEFSLSLPERLVYKNGLKKVILRKAMTGRMPDSIVNRTDKMGFVTPEEVWLKNEGTQWFRQQVMETLDRCPEYFDREQTIRLFDEMVAGKTKFTFAIWRIVCFGKWLQMMDQYR